ncbi:hypothetical protein FACS1894182_09260 [Bacteroidia bacterium]|nr:hypothetical protein FACS1894182_09260 [Bacteroidia bacterium]
MKEYYQSQIKTIDGQLQKRITSCSILQYFTHCITSVPLKLGGYKKSNKLGSLESHRSLSY